MMKRLFLLILSSCLLFLLAACDGQTQAPAESPPADGPVALTVWGAEEDEALLQEIFASFQAHYAGQASFQITFQPQSESNCKDVLLGDLEGGWTPSGTRPPFAVPPSPPPWRRPAWAAPSTPTR